MMELGWTPELVPVEVVMIGSRKEAEYLGCYDLSETVKFEKSRLDLKAPDADAAQEEGSGNITGAYLISIYNMLQDEGEPLSNIFETDTVNGMFGFMFREPKFESEDLTEAQRAEKAAVRPPLWRLRVPDETISFVDGHFGPYSENLAAECGDFILRRADGVFAYQLAVTADDIAAGVTEVVRGRDLISSTPRQLYLYRLLDAPAPRYFHVPLLSAPDGRRLSKRDRDLDLGILRERYDAREIIGALAHAAGLTEAYAPCSPGELIGLFDWKKVPLSDFVPKL